MANIYYDIFMVDRYIEELPDFRAMSDSTAVYEAVFDKYGYNSDKFLRSIEYYLSKPKIYKKILEDVKERFLKREQIVSGEKKDQIINPDKDTESDKIQVSSDDEKIEKEHLPVDERIQ